jgi:FAD/FMN-containing dehydrogenase
MAKPTIADLRPRVRGQVISRDDDGYEEARKVYNAMIDKHPLAVIRCTGPEDAAAVVDFARENGVDLAIRGGGHSVPGFGTCDDGVVADLSGMQGVDVDPKAKTARAQGGATWGMFNDATYAHGLATTGGIISTTGVVGLTTGGGIGYLARGAGLSCDNVIGADVVTADGRTVRASEKENPDLFWALLGGGGNFGVVTTMDFRLIPVKDVYVAVLFFELDDARGLFEFYRDFIARAPEQLGAFPGWQIAPPLPFIPENRHGDTFVVFVSLWAGPIDEGANVIKPVRDVGPVVAELSGPMPYPALNGAFDALLPPGLQQYWKANYLTELSDGQIQAQLEWGPKVPTMNSTAHIYPINGAAQRVAPDATAFGHREASFATVIAGAWPDPADNEKNTAWVRGFYEASSKYGERGGYVNFAAGDEGGRIKDNYGANYDKLVEAKRKYDPGNVFHVNQNIAP